MKKISLPGSTYEYMLILSREDLEVEIEKLAQKIMVDYPDKSIPLLLLIILNGGMFFGTQLCQALQRKGRSAHIDTIRMESYGPGNKQGDLRMTSKPAVTNWPTMDVIVVEDLVDSGHTFKWINNYLKPLKPRSLNYAVLLEKKRDESILAFSIKYKIMGEIEKDWWVVGLGMDDNQDYRGFDGICYKIQS